MLMFVCSMLVSVGSGPVEVVENDDAEEVVDDEVLDRDADELGVTLVAEPVELEELIPLDEFVELVRDETIELVELEGEEVFELVAVEDGEDDMFRVKTPTIEAITTSSTTIITSATESPDRDPKAFLPTITRILPFLYDYCPDYSPTRVNSYW